MKNGIYYNVYWNRFYGLCIFLLISINFIFKDWIYYVILKSEQPKGGGGNPARLLSAFIQGKKHTKGQPVLNDKALFLMSTHVVSS